MTSLPPRKPKKARRVKLPDGVTLRDYFAGQVVVWYSANARVMDMAIDDWESGRRPT
jgi:hypothetical protein